ncbi:Helicase, C-terminal [Ostreococcus tauri]|uniref:RNA helicase n=1 Tax=Ostreococcus tauri TaxID=70448 RepID=A0A090M731_OSTTA|nr:Helicase, C-terminal [Ostreococcus tauri]CEF98487.1 Helicase, C-terminal [Ostreococcus tauri]|eukprot:XP_022839288.1 Helicase, C-terminal [Ostreococcus tauri]
MRAKNTAAAARKPTERRKSDAVDDDDASRPIASSAKNTKAKSSKKTNDASKSNDVGMEKDGHVEFAQAEALTGRRRTLEAKKKKSSGGFESMEILPEVFRAVKRKGYRVPTPIQRKAIPPALEGRDVVAMARTGSGKTAAFLIPVLSKLRTHSLKAGARCVVLAPTRELALQTFAFAKELSKFTNLRVAALVGGDSMEAQFADLSNNPDIIVATPGRLLHHVEEVKAFTLRTVCHVVLDEADRLLEMGFADQLRQVMSSVADVRQTLLFSATLPSALAEFVRVGLREPEVVRLDAEMKISTDLKMSFILMRNDEKVAALLYMLREVIPKGQQTVVFASTRHHVEWLHNLLEFEGVRVSSIYGSMDMMARKMALSKFRAKKADVLMVTDVAARGIDIPLLDNVINYDFPSKGKLFVHRVGRVARAGRTGNAHSFLVKEELGFLVDLHLFLGRKIAAASKLPPNSTEEAAEIARAADESATSIIGTCPLGALDMTVDRLRELMKERDELEGMERAASNAYKLYQKTRGAASSESMSRAQPLIHAGPHPLLCASGGVDATTQELAQITASIRAYRPQATVLEAEVASATKVNGSMRLTETSRAMQQKRLKDEKFIKAKREGKTIKGRALRPLGEDDPILNQEGLDNDVNDGGADYEAMAAPAEDAFNTGKFRDQDFFLDNAPRAVNHTELGLSTREGAYGALEDATMDLVEEDGAGISRQKKLYHWDARKKRYVHIRSDEIDLKRGGKRIKNEAGQRVSAVEAGATYKKWVAKTHKSITATGSMEDESTASQRAFVDSSRFKRGWHTKGAQQAEAPSVFGVGAGEDELKNADQIRKERKEDKKKKQRMSGGRGGGGRGGGGRGGGGRGGGGRGGGGRGGRGGRSGGRGGGRGKR